MADIPVTPQTQVAITPFSKIGTAAQIGGPVGFTAVENIADGLTGKLVAVSGSSMTGPLILSGPPSDPNGAVTLAFLNNFIGTQLPTSPIGVPPGQYWIMGGHLWQVPDVNAIIAIGEVFYLPAAPESLPPNVLLLNNNVLTLTPSSDCLPTTPAENPFDAWSNSGTVMCSLNPGIPISPYGLAAGKIWFNGGVICVAL